MKTQPSAQQLPAVAPGPAGLSTNSNLSTQSIIIEPQTGWAALNFREVWEYRDLLYFMIWRDLKARYRQTALGPLWIILQPIVSMVLYTVVFGWIAKLPSDGVPYSVFSYVGLLPWGFFSDAVSASSGGLSGNKDLISKVYFPRLIGPISKTAGRLVDLAVEGIILVLMLLYFRIQPSWGLVLIPLFLFIAAATGLGFGMLFSGIVVKYRDVGNVVGYIMRAWMYAVPVVYSATLIPPQWLWLYSLNPIYSVIVGFRWALTGTEAPAAWAVVVNTLTAIVLFVLGLYVFKRAERNIVDVL